MFWSGNFIVVRELNFLLKEENVTLTQVLEADDILQECKADNKALMQFLTRPDILAELITLITEEPPKSVELAQQYRHASIACEVLTSSLSMLSDRLSMDTAQMNRLCDFVNRDPPLNPLLASYFSKTVEMLLERSPKQDWYLYHIVCLRVLDFFKSRRDFLPNLLRHMATSAIADTFKFFIRLDDLFNKIIMEWLEEHQFLDSVIGIVCGAPGSDAAPEKGQHDSAETELRNHKHDDAGDSPPEASPDHQNNHPCAASAELQARSAAVASANAAALLCELVATGCSGEGGLTRSRTSWALVTRLESESGVRSLLAAMFTSGPRARSQALVHGCEILLSLLYRAQSESEGTLERNSVELGVALHLPLLHQALLDTSLSPQHLRADGEAVGEEAVGSARLQVAALLAHLAASTVDEVTTTMLTLGTAGVLIDMFFRYSNNNFLHSHVAAFCRRALRNPAYRTTHATHLLVECDLLTRLMDAFEENESKQESPRSGYMGHALCMLSAAGAALDDVDVPLAPPVVQRWRAFLEDKLRPMLALHDTPLGGSYPSDSLYEMDNMTDTLAANFDFQYAMTSATMDEVGDDLSNDNEVGSTDAHADSAEFIADGLGVDDDDKTAIAKNRFLELNSERFSDDMWDEALEPDLSADGLPDGSPWEGASNATPAEGWAQFGSEVEGAAGPREGDPFAAPYDTFAAPLHYWPYDHTPGAEETPELCARMRDLQLSGGTSLATNLLTAMSAMSPDAVANIVNANLHPLPLQECALATDTGLGSGSMNIEAGTVPSQIGIVNTELGTITTLPNIKNTEICTVSTEVNTINVEAGTDSTQSDIVSVETATNTTETSTSTTQSENIKPLSTDASTQVSSTPASKSDQSTNITVSPSQDGNSRLPSVPGVTSIIDENVITNKCEVKTNETLNLQDATVESKDHSTSVEHSDKNREDATINKESTNSETIEINQILETESVASNASEVISETSSGDTTETSES